MWPGLSVRAGLASIMVVVAGLASLPLGWAQDEATAMAKAIAAFAKGDLATAADQCSEVMFSDAEPGIRSRAYAMLALGYHLQDRPDAVDRTLDLNDLCAETEDLERAVLLPVLGHLAGKQSAAAMTEALDQATPDWQAFGLLCQYVVALRENAAEPETLNRLGKEYAAATAIMTGKDWGAAWKGRIVHWQRCLLEKKAQAPLEPLVAKWLPAAEPELEPVVEATPGPAHTPRREIVAAVNRVVELYLENRRADAEQAAVKAAGELRDLAPADAPVAGKILGYLAGDAKVSPQDIFSAAQTNPQLWALGCVAMFVRDVAVADSAGNLAATRLLHHLDNYHGNLALIQDEGGITGWEKRTREWESWCTGRFARRPGLPLLLASRSLAGSAASPVAPAVAVPMLSTVTLEQFSAGREERYQNRPRPASLSFDAAAFNRYVATLPPAVQAVEKRRFEVVARVKHQLAKIFERNPYRGEIFFRSGPRRGMIAMANENLLYFKRSDRAKGERYEWSDLDFAQYPAFFEHFAKMRMSVTAGQVTREERQFNAANDYLGLALLCDWFGHYEQALTHAKRAVELAPNIEAEASELLLP